MSGTWKALEEADGELPKATEAEPATAPAATAGSTIAPSTCLPSTVPNSYTPDGIAAAHEQRVLATRIAEARHRLFVVDDVRPLSWPLPPEWGEPVSAVPITIKGFCCISYIFAGGQTAHRCAVKVHGYDD